jgi:hypothetical protein
MSIYKCIDCNVEFKTNSGLWKHNKNKHLQIKEIIIKFNCKYCEKELSDRHCLWRHETKTCKKNPDIIAKQTNQFNISDNGTLIQNKNGTLIQNQTNINNINNINHNNITINFNAPGKENILELSEEARENILSDGLNSLVTLIKLLNFNKDLPQNHTFCNTNLNNKCGIEKLINFSIPSHLRLSWIGFNFFKKIKSPT